MFLEATLDKSVPEDWRNLCMNHIFQPLRNLYRLAKHDGDFSGINKIYFVVSKTRIP